MKKKISVLVVSAILINCMLFGASAATLYAPDGRKIEVEDAKVNDWVNVGWYEGERLYAPDGRTVVVSPFDVQRWVNVGWHKGKKLYSPNGNTMKVSPFDTQKWIDVGWFTYPVTRMYDSDGKKIVVAKSEIEAYEAMGWSLTYDADSQQISKFIGYLNTSLENDNDAIDCITYYLRYDREIYKTWFWDYLDNSYEAVNKAYDMSLTYTNLKPTSANLKKMIEVYDSIYDGNYNTYTLTSAFGKIIEYEKDVIDFMEELCN